MSKKKQFLTNICEYHIVIKRCTCTSLADRQIADWLHDDIIKWKHFPRYWPFVRGTHRSSVTGSRWISLTKASDAELWCFFLSALWINGWASNHGAGDLRRHRAHYDGIIMDWIDRRHFRWIGRWLNVYRLEKRARERQWIWIYSKIICVYSVHIYVSHGFREHRNTWAKINKNSGHTGNIQIKIPMANTLLANVMNFKSMCRPFTSAMNI